MNIIITDVTPHTATVNGQELTRHYLEEILLPLAVAAQGKNDSAIIKVAKAFDEAELSLKSSPQAVRVYAHFKQEQREADFKAQAWANANALRCQEPTREELAKRKAKRLEDNAKIRAIGEASRAQRR